MSLLFPAERRRYPRVIPHHGRPVEVQLMGSGFLDVFFAEDISERGLAIRVPHGFSGCDITDSVDLIITIPRVPAFKARGMVRRTVRSPDRTLFGVELTEIAPKNQAAIARYVEAMMALGRGA